ncbi:MAG: hypothetical protein JOZ38_03750, partial [Candidatus Eremiobacteraeota bacterium]|nr:hypothetical protein [Candidatus Eremiobacteraeota bacterium]
MILRFFRIDSLDKRLIAGLGAVIVLLIVVSVTGLSQFLQTKSAVTNIASNAFPVYQDAAKGSMAVAQFHAAAVSQTTTGDPKYVAQEKAASANFSAASDAFLKTNLDKDLKT